MDNYDDLLKDCDELLEFTDEFSFDEIYTEKTDSNNYFMEPENKHISEKNPFQPIQPITQIQPIQQPTIRPRKMQQTIPKKTAKILKPQAIKEEPKVTYNDILDHMGIFVSNGKLHLKEDAKNSDNNQYFENVNNNNTYSYIHNKYFKDYDNQDDQGTPQFQNPTEYRNYLIKQIIHNYKTKHQIKTKRIQIHGDASFDISPNGYSDLNKLFQFSQR